MPNARTHMGTVWRGFNSLDTVYRKISKNQKILQEEERVEKSSIQKISYYEKRLAIGKSHPIQINVDRGYEYTYGYMW